MTWNLPWKTVLFEETPETKTPYEFHMSVMFLVTAGDDFHSFRVLSVVDGGPAAQAGVKPDDVILDVDGVPAGKLTLEQIRSQFKNEKATRALTLQRKGERDSAKLTLRRMV